MRKTGISEVLLFYIFNVLEILMLNLFRFHNGSACSVEKVSVVTDSDCANPHISSTFGFYKRYMSQERRYATDGPYDFWFSAIAMYDLTFYGK